MNETNDNLHKSLIHDKISNTRKYHYLNVYKLNFLRICIYKRIKKYKFLIRLDCFETRNQHLNR